MNQSSQRTKLCRPKSALTLNRQTSVTIKNNSFKKSTSYLENYKESVRPQENIVNIRVSRDFNMKVSKRPQSCIERSRSQSKHNTNAYDDSKKIYKK